MAARTKAAAVPRGRLIGLGRHAIPGLEGSRRVRVWVPALPPPHAVAYCWDGQNLFGDRAGHPGWHLDEDLARRAARGRFAPLVVAIDHGGVQRIPDYAPWPHPQFGPGHADALLAWVVQELKPRIDREFQPLGRTATLVCGSSMGGLLSLYAWLRYPEVFGAALAMSPSLWFDADALTAEIARARPLPDARLYLDIGEREMGPWGPRLLRAAADGVAQRGLSAERVLVRVDPRGRHNELHWRRRLGAALDFLGPETLRRS